MRNIRIQDSPQENEVVDRLVADGWDPRLVRAGIVLLRRGSADLIQGVLDGEITIKQAMAAMRRQP
jgi:hypothetical protein